MAHSIVQLAGDVRSIQDFYTGLTRELTVVTDTHELRLHDGIKLGGYRILNSSQNDAKYQAKSAELTSLTNLAVSKSIGILVRLGVGNYVARKLVPEATTLTLANNDKQGSLGDFQLNLANTIAKPVAFSKPVTFAGITATAISGPLTGNVTGNLTGNVAGNLTGNVAGILTGNANGSHTGTFAGNVDLRNGILQLDPNQIPLTAVNGNLILSGDQHLLQTGFILSWYGLLTAIPTGFLLCDGTLGTPDLRDKMLIGAGGLYAKDAVGGATTHNHGGSSMSTLAGLHSHTVTVAPHVLQTSELPAHAHLTPEVMNSNTAFKAGTLSQIAVTVLTRMDATQTSGGTSGYNYFTDATGGGSGHSHGGSSVSAGSHSHAVGIPSANNLPPYYALAFIMKT